MNYKFAATLIIFVLAGTNAYGSIKEVEQNDSFSTANPLVTYDENVGQLNNVDDQDWFSVNVTDPNQQSTPVYFGCNFKLGDHLISANPNSVLLDDERTFWDVSYYSPDNVLQGSYVVAASACAPDKSDIKGPLRFEMNTKALGMYYIKVKGGIIPNIGPAAPTGDYKIRVYTGRTDGEMEPNDGLTDAFQITKASEIIGQLSSQYDQDWFYFDNAESEKTTDFYLKCSDDHTERTYFVSSYNAKGVLQRSQEISQAACAADTGFKMTIYTPQSARNYILVNIPTYPKRDNFTQADYILSASPIFNSVASALGTADFNAHAGVLTKASIIDKPAAQKDTFSATVRQCGSTKGVIKLTGSNLDLTGLDTSTQVKILLDGWSCTSDAKVSTTTSNKGKKTYVYPKPVVKSATPTAPSGFPSVGGK